MIEVYRDRITTKLVRLVFIVALASYPLSVTIPSKASQLKIEKHSPPRQALAENVTALDWGQNRLVAVGYSSGKLNILDSDGMLLNTFTMPAYISGVKWEHTGGQPLLAVAVNDYIWIVDVTGAHPSFSFRDTNVAGDVSAITWHPTTRQLAVALQLGVSASLNPVDIWNIDTQTMAVLFRDYEIETSVAWHPLDPDVIAVGFIDGRAELWQLSNKTMLYRVNPTIPDDIVHTLAWSPDGTHLAIGYDFSLRVLSYPTYQDILTYTVSGVINEIAWHSDSRRLAILVTQGIEVIDASNGSQLYSETIPGFMYSVAWSPDGKRLIYGGNRTGFRGEYKIFDAPALSASATPSHSP